MALESFKSKKPGETKPARVGDIRRLGMPEIQKKPEARSGEIYKALKQTPLYIADREDWGYYMSAEQRVGADSDRYFVYNQLLGIYTDALFDRSRAKQKFATLKRASFNDEMWQDNIMANDLMPAPAQFIGLLVEALFSPEAVKEKFALLKKDYYLKEEKRWKAMSPVAEHNRSTRTYTTCELYAVWLETELFPERAESLLAELKASDFYDQVNKNWHKTNSDWGGTTLLRADLLLLELLITSQYAPEVACAGFKTLKAGHLYDAEHEQWNMSYSSFTDELNSTRCTQTQLLGVILEHRFEELFSEPPALSADAPAIPVEKNI